MREKAGKDLMRRIEELEQTLLLEKESARESEERYRALFDRSFFAVYILDLDGNVLEANDVCLNMLGYNREHLLNLNFWDLISDDQVPDAVKSRDELLRTGVQERPMEYCLRHRDGGHVWVETTSSVIYRGGRPYAMQGIARNISEQKKVQETIRQSEERYRSILDNMQEAYYEVDLKGKFTFFNLPAITRLGYTVEEMRDMNYQRFTDQENARKLFDAYHQVFTTGKPITGLEWDVTNKSGDKIPVEASVSLKYDAAGNPVGFMGIVRDVTERRKAQDALRRSEEKYRSILESIQEGYVEYDLAGNTVFFNDSCLRMLGYTCQEMKGMNYRVFTSPETARRIYQVFHAIYLTGRPDVLLDYEVIRKDGSKRVHEMSASLIRNASGEPIGFRGIARDVTERKRAEEALKQSEERWQFALEGAGDGVWDLNLKTGKAFRSHRWKEMLGYRDEEIADSRDEWTRLVHPDDRGSSDEELYRHIRGESPLYVSEYRIQCKDGSYKWILDRGKIIEWDSDGSALRIIGTQSDITERKRAEDALRQSEGRYRTIFEHTATANIIVTEDATILLANSKFEKLAGYTKNELEGRMKWTSFVMEEDLERMKRYHTMRRTDPASAPNAYEFRGVMRSGEVKDLFMSAAMIPDTKESVASIIDITDRKKAEEDLRQSEERFRDMARLMPETIFETNEAGVLTFTNEAAFEKFLYTSEDMDMGLRALDMLAPEDRKRAYENIARVLAGERIGLSEYLARRKDGTTFPVLVHSTVILKNRRPSGIRGFMIDISEKKALEEQFMRAQKMEAIGTLAGGIAHDFNNLLMGILGNVSLMLLDMEQTHPFYDRLKNVEEYVHQGSELTKQFLGFARGGKYEVKPTHLGDFIQRSAEMFGRTKKEIVIHQRVQEGLWIVEVDRSQMDQVLLNLFVNAWQAMPGGGNLYLSTENVELEETDVAPFGIKPGRFVKVSVTDTGIGMDEEVKAHIFEPFFTTKGKGRGTGLGLASVYGIVKNHKGIITVDSKKGEGSIFTIYLPASDKTVQEDRRFSSEIRKGRETILLIDDEEMILEVGSEMLKTLGYDVLTASGGRAGLEMFSNRRDSIALVVLDMIMPDLGGKETFEGLRKIEPEVKVLLSSGYSLNGQAKEIMDKGCKGFIQKPFSISVLAERIRVILDGR